MNIIRRSPVLKCQRQGNHPFEMTNEWDISDLMTASPFEVSPRAKTFVMLICSTLYANDINYREDIDDVNYCH